MIDRQSKLFCALGIWHRMAYPRNNYNGTFTTIRSHVGTQRRLGMNIFDRANEALRHDLEAYTRALRTIVTALPQARDLCDCVVKETRLARALLAFATGPQIADLAQLAFHLTNLWPYREQAYARTVGFADEIAEARRQREEAQRGMRLLARQTSDPLASEVSGCFENIARYLEEEQ